VSPKFLLRFLIAALVAVVALVPLVSGTAFGQAAAPAPILPDALSWFGPPGNPALRAAWVLGTEQGAAPYLLRVRLAQGGRIPVHTHPDTRNSTVLSGTLYVGFGDTADEGKMVAVPTGAVYVAPAHVAHFLWARDGDVVYQEGGVGPTATLTGAAATRGTAAAAGAVIAGSGLREVGRFEGIWKRCYEPGLERVTEIDSGYLVVLPDLRFYELGASCCHGPSGPQPPFGSLGTYTLAGDGVTLSAKRNDGSRYEIPLRYRASARAVFFDSPRSAPIDVEALLPGDDLDYAWCRVYPEPKRQ
jgi:quercetin dioxygenase-like cupin family protein